MNIRLLRSGLAAAAAVAPSLAFAHTGVGDAHGFAHGVAHPVGGVDHVLAMVAVGMFAAVLGGRALWAVPASFVGMMAVGGLLGIEGVDVPFVETGIAASVIVLGLAVAAQVHVATVAAMALAGVFAVFHGHAHGAEMPSDASGAGYALGFMLATAALHAVGVAVGLGLGRIGRSGGGRLALQAGGGAMALAGVGILAGYI